MTPTNLPPSVPETFSDALFFEFVSSAEGFQAKGPVPPRPNGPPRPTAEEIAEDRRTAEEWFKKNRPPQN